MGSLLCRRRSVLPQFTLSTVPLAGIPSTVSVAGLRLAGNLLMPRDSRNYQGEFFADLNKRALVLDPFH